jgi:hypothetical protein
MRILRRILGVSFALSLLVIALALALSGAYAQDKQENYASWPLLKSTFPSTGGNGIMIKGYDPVITGGKCVTTFMAALPSGEVYFNVVEFDAVPAQGGTLCTGGKWRSFDGKSTGTTPYRVFFKDGVFRGAPN